MGLVNKVVEPDELWDEVDRWLALVRSVSPVIVQMQKISYTQHDDFINPERGPVEEYIPDYNDSAESLERRTVFLERRPLDPSKNLPFVSIPID